LLPDKCSIKEGTKDCVNPPEFVITVMSVDDQFMLGLTCQKHKTHVLSKIESLQEQKKIPSGTIKFEDLKSVKTDCVRGDPDDLIQL
jgi:hypothetical protein